MPCRSYALLAGVLVILSAPALCDPLPLLATHRSQVIQNRRADTDDLSRFRSQAMVKRFARIGLLKKVPSKTRHYYLRRVPSSYRYLRPWARMFLDRLSRQYYARFKKPLRVTSLVRTVSYQRSLRRRNGNAAAATGHRRSTHLTGATLDISKAVMSAKERAWMRRVLGQLRASGYIYAIEESRQPTFHIMVHKKYQKYVQRKTGRKPKG